MDTDNGTQQSPQVFTQRTDLSKLEDAVARIKGELHRIIVGQERMIELLIAALFANGHVLIEGVPGIAKTLAAKLLARTLSVDFSRIQFTPDLMPSDVLGTSVFNLKNSDFEFKSGPIFSNFVLIDEINRAPAKTQSALFEVMEERQVTIDGETRMMQPPFFVIATQNPIDQEGTYRLPEAQLDRFLFKIEAVYPQPEEEAKILSEFHGRRSVNDLSLIRPVLDAAGISSIQETVRSLHIEQNLLQYIADIVCRTRNNPSVFLGASPRASLAILVAAKAMAAIRGRDFVTPEDVREVAYPVLGHRISLTPEREMEGVRPQDVVRQILETLEVPR